MTHPPARGSFFDQSGLDNYLRAGQFFNELLNRVRRLTNVMTAGAAVGLPTGQHDSNLFRDGLVRVHRAADPLVPTIYQRGERAEAETVVPG